MYLLGPNPESSDTGAPVFVAAPTRNQKDTEWVVHRVRERILRSLDKGGVVPDTAAPGDGEVNAALGEGFGETDPTRANAPCLLD